MPNQRPSSVNGGLSTLPHPENRNRSAKRAGCTCEQKAGGRLVGAAGCIGNGTAGLDGARTGPRSPRDPVELLTCASGQPFSRNRFDSDGTAHPGAPRRLAKYEAFHRVISRPGPRLRAPVGAAGARVRQGRMPRRKITPCQVILRNYCVDLARHRADATAETTSRRWRGAPEI